MKIEPQDKFLVAGSNPDPASPNHAPIKSAVEARGGIMLGRMRWVLAISLAGVIVALAITWLVGR